MRVALSLLTLAVLLGGVLLGLAALFGVVGAPDPEDLVAQAAELHEQGRYVDSAALYLQAAELWDADGAAGEALAARAQRGVCLKLAGQLDRAREVLEAALSEARAREMLATEGLALGNLAKVEALAGDFDASLRRFDALIEVAQEGHDERTEILAREQAALLVDSLGRHAEAVQRFDEALLRHADLDLGVDDRRAALARQKAWSQAQLGDDLGARATWAAAAPGPAGSALQAQHLATLGLHMPSAELAISAARALAAEPERRDADEDRALELGFVELLAAGELALVQAELEEVLKQLDDPARRAPFELIRARCLLMAGAPGEAVERASAAREGFGADLRAQEAAWIEAIARVEAGVPEEALTQLQQQPACLARSVLEGWISDLVPARELSFAEELPLLDPSRLARDDESFFRLQQISPEPLPDPAFLALHLALADADRLRVQGQEALAHARIDDGLVAALQWQALLARHRLRDRWPEAATRAADAAAPAGPGDVDVAPRVRRWVSGELPAEEAVIAVLPGPMLSYLVYFTQKLGGMSIGIAPAHVLEQRVRATVAALRVNVLDDVARASYELFAEIFPEQAQVDLRGSPRWTLLLPDLLAGVPPVMWVSAPTEPGEAVPWLVRSHDVRLMPYVLPQPLAAGLPQVPWVQFGEPALPEVAPALVADHLNAVYGMRGPPKVPLRPRPAPPQSGAAANVPALLAELANPGVVEVAVPGFGGGRLGGLLLSPAPDAPRGDAAAGFLPWHRLAEVPLAAALVLDGTRFVPDDPEHGPVYAATAAFAGGVRQLALLRWPLPDPLLWGMVDRIEQGADGILTLAGLVCHAQRLYIAGAEQVGQVDRTHPRVWASWLVFDAGP